MDGVPLERFKAVMIEQAKTRVALREAILRECKKCVFYRSGKCIEPRSADVCYAGRLREVLGEIEVK